MQEDNADFKTASTSGSSAESNSFFQGVKPKVKSQLWTKDNKPIELSKSISNGFASQGKKSSDIKNGTYSSSVLPSLSSSSSSSSIVNDLLYDTNNTEKSFVKGRILSSEESDLKTNDKKDKPANLVDNENSSENEGDEGLSGDDCCIYTYKGDQFADLPNSFYRVEIGEHDGENQSNENRREINENGIRNQPTEREDSNPGSSPEMDYLEMDFDPGPSLEQDSEEDVDDFETKSINDCSVPDLPKESVTDDLEEAVNLKSEVKLDCENSKPGPSYETICLCLPHHSKVTNYCACSCSRTEKMSDLCATNHNSVKETTENYDYLELKMPRGKLEFEDDSDKIFRNQFFEEKKVDKKNLWTDRKELTDLIEDNDDHKSEMPFDGVMFWTEQEAISKQFTLVSSEVSCGATAIINVMLVLKMRLSIEKVKEGISARLKSDSASIPQYLVSRSFSGVAQENLIRGIQYASCGELFGRFFQTYPRRDIILSEWLSHWMKKGAVPIATTNVKRSATVENLNGDTRHHQMIFGVNSKGIYLTNPLECLQDEELWNRLTSPLVLNIKRQEIMSRWSPETNLKPLMFQNDDRWRTMNVLGQVVNVIRESMDPSAQEKFLTQHISIPASSGITLIIPKNSSAYEELISAPDLPLLAHLKAK